MNKDNIQELLKPRYKVIADYPEMERHNIRIGDVITRSESPMYADKTQDGTPVVAIDHEIFPAVFRRLEWWEDMDVKDMPEYLQRNTKDKIIFKAVKHNVDATHGLGFVTSEGKIKSYCNYLPTTETEYLNQNNQQSK